MRGQLRTDIQGRLWELGDGGDRECVERRRGTLDGGHEGEYDWSASDDGSSEYEKVIVLGPP